MLLVGDIGATKTKLAVFSPEAGLRKPLAEAVFPSARYSCLEILVREFLTQISLPIERAIFGVAGPVVAGQVAITNLPWIIKELQLREALNLSYVRLMNDLEAVAYAVPFLESIDLHTLNVGQPTTDGTCAIIAPGTGLGEAFLTRDGSRYQPYASAGGHTDFAPTNPIEIELLRYLLERYEHISYERVCSGLGLPNIYAYLRDSGYSDEPVWLSEQLAITNDFTSVIVNAALNVEAPCPLCVATLNTFVSILGAEAGNLALKILSTGGVYLGGGIPPRILPFLENGRFMLAFQQKGRFTELLARIPVYIILNSKTALLGAARYGLEM